MLSFLRRRYDSKQAATLGQMMFLVDSKDEVVAKIDKLTAHNYQWILSEQGLPHRAFSVFLFNSQGDLLLQQRSRTKITYPLHWTNTCCSHPLTHTHLDGISQESLERVLFELNFNQNSPLSFISKIRYRAQAEGLFGEYELDYLFFGTLDTVTESTEIAFNTEEVNDVMFIPRNEAQNFVLRTDLEVTPWFRGIISQTQFLSWWAAYLSQDYSSLPSPTHITNLL